MQRLFGDGTEEGLYVSVANKQRRILVDLELRGAPGE
jgi:hypothetical protein